MEPRTALLAGATGKVGSCCLRLLLASPRYREVQAAARGEATVKHPQLIWRQTDFDALKSIPLPPIDDAFCVLGVRRNFWTDRRELELAEYAYPLAFAKLAKARGARRFLTVTSVAADSGSPFFTCAPRAAWNTSWRNSIFNPSTFFAPACCCPRAVPSTRRTPCCGGRCGNTARFRRSRSQRP